MRKIISLFRNLYYNLRYPYKLNRAKKELTEWRAKLKDGKMAAFKTMMCQFRYRSDGAVEWVPDSPEMVVARGWTDDCDGAAVLAQWGFRQIGMPCRIYRLVRSGGGHRVCVTNDHRYFTSNGSVVEIPTATDWKNFILSWNWHKVYRYYQVVELS